MVGLLLAGLVLGAGWSEAALRIEVVDDTGDPNPPYLLLVGKPAAGFPLSVDAGTGQLAVADASQATNNVSPLPLNFLQPAGYSVTSAYTGK